MIFLPLFIFCCDAIGVFAWSNEEFALYDLVEEVEDDFYTLFAVSKVGV